MTPLKLFLTSIFLMIVFGLLSDIKQYDKKRYYYLIEISFFIWVGSIIWGIFYYIKV